MFKLLTKLEAVKQVEKDYQGVAEGPEFVDWEATRKKQSTKVFLQIIVVSIILLYLAGKIGMDWTTLNTIQMTFSVLGISLLAQGMLVGRYMVVQWINKIIN